MKTVNYVAAACAIVIAVLSVNVQGAFMVETWPGSVGYPIPGLANENYVGDGIPSSDLYPSASRAVGVTAASAVYSTIADSIYTFYYTPSPAGCSDMDNAVFAAGTDLGNGDLATGLVGGGAGLYNVYATWRYSTNVEQDNVNFTVTSEGNDVSLVNVQQYGSAPGSDTWLLIAEGVRLVTGRTYTITQTPTIDGLAYVSMRSHGVMWEFVEPIEPLADIVVDGGELNLEEGGDSGQYTIALKEQPPTMIIVTAQVCEPNQITLNGEHVLELEFKFTPDDWDVVRTVNVGAVDDDIAEAETPIWIVHMTDPNEVDFDPNSIWNNGYGGLVTVNIMGDVPDIRITETDGTTEVSEEGPTSDDYLVKLTYPPDNIVTVIIETDGQVLVDTGSGAGTTASLEFTPSDWSVDQPVTVTAVDDEVLEYAHTSQITHIASSLDGGYDGLQGRDVVVTIEDNECGVWGYFELDLNEDCVVDIDDFAEFAAAWLECTQPYGENCVDLR